MSKEKYQQAIYALNEEIAKQNKNSQLFYQRGYLYFLLGDEQRAKEDYTQAVSFGLDVTEDPYYAFSLTNKMRRDFVMPEKILVFLILLIVGFGLTMQIASFIMKVKRVFPL